MKKTLIYLISAAVVLIIVAVIGKKQGWFGEGEIEKVSTEKPLKRTITEIITANGTIQPKTEVKISPDVSGEIVDLFIAEGEEVKAGKLLLKIKPDTYLSSLERMVASVNASKANLANAKARLTQVEATYKQKELDHKRNQELFNKGAISKSDYEASLAAYEIAKADVEAAKETVSSSHYNVKSAEASLKEANENLTKTDIYAPMDGTISMLNVEKGERVVGTMQMAGTEMLRIADLNKMEVLVEVNENDIVRVKMGDTALIEIDAYIDQKFKGVVTEIANSANVSSTVSSDQVINFEVKIEILKESYQHLIPANNPNFYPFRPGMSATVDIQTFSVVNVVSVPIQAITTRSDSILNNSGEIQEVKEEDKEFKKKETTTKKDKKEIVEIVFIYKDGKVFAKEVETGIQDNNYIEIKSGLSLDDEVVIAPYLAISKKLKNEMKVEKSNKDKLYTKEKE
jgi:HlyD family secretion protein